jgi:hypothetical protein
MADLRMLVDPPPADIIEAAEKVSRWAAEHNFGSGWQIAGVCDRDAVAVRDKRIANLERRLHLIATSSPNSTVRGLQQMAYAKPGESYSTMAQCPECYFVFEPGVAPGLPADITIAARSTALDIMAAWRDPAHVSAQMPGVIERIVAEAMRGLVAPVGLAELKPSGEIAVTAADAEMMIGMLDNPPPPNAALQRAFERHRTTITNPGAEDPGHG